jgi:hypothetical protein
MLLQSVKQSLEFAEFDPETSKLHFFRRAEYLSPNEFIRLSGLYEKVGDTLVCFYRCEGELRLRIGEREIPITDDVSSVLERSSNNLLTRLRSALTLTPMFSFWRLFESGKMILEFRYIAPEPEKRSPLDFTAFVDEEDEDFILFVHNVMNDLRRRNEIWLKRQ